MLSNATMKDVDETAENVRNQVKLSGPTDMEMKDSNSNSIDESLYSRQLYVMGREAQKRMGGSNVLIVGLNGLGVEIAKNVILAGVKSVTIKDESRVSWMDLSSQFYLSEQHIGQPRAEACREALADLNPYVEVQLTTSALDEQSLVKYQTVILVNQPMSLAQSVDAICHQHSIPFISTSTFGVFGSVFCDFGEKFIVKDKDGEPEIDCMIASITSTNDSNELLVTVMDDARHQLQSGDSVTFREVEGIDGLNGCEPLPVTVTGPYTFTIKTKQSQGAYVKGGYVSQVKKAIELNFKSLTNALATPGEFLISDFAKMTRSGILHQGFKALDQFMQESGRAPTPGDVQDAKKVVEYAIAVNNECQTRGEFFVEELEKDVEALNVIEKLALGAAGTISPMTALFGGVVGQEALKACSGKFSPIQQFFYFDAVECLPSEPLSADDVAPLNCRYDSQIAVFGKSFQAKLNNAQLFLVGAGAIGCEMLKNWALMGVGAGKTKTLTTEGRGHIYVTDMDMIEKSNLNRQFLFRSKDVSHPKSRTAALAATAMNPEMNITSYEERVGNETENIFSEKFYKDLDGVCTALDNVDARMYMDSKCLFHQLPMFESGTLGTKGNTQIVVPHLTENYGASRDPPEKSIPICTLKNFPNQIHHTLQWARDWFEGVFFQTPQDVNQYLSNPSFLSTIESNQKVETLERLDKSLVKEKPLSFDECIVWARKRFDEMFYNQIAQLLHNFPLDQKTSTGAPFWSGPKRPPSPISFDSNDPLHVDFIVAVSNAHAANYGLVGRKDREYFTNVLPSIQLPKFVPKENVKIATTEAEMKDTDMSSGPSMEENMCEAIINDLPKPGSLAGYRMVPIEFEKDDDSHMAVIVATSNLRARNYKIPEADMHQSRLIAGKIIPAIATTTALVTGLVCLEMYKVIQMDLQNAKFMKDNSEKLRAMLKNGFVNLALPLFAFSEPIAPATTTTMWNKKEWKWTAWDSLDVNIGDVTLKEFLDHFEKEYEANISMLSYGVSILYSLFTSKAKLKERMSMKMTQLVETITKKPIDSSKTCLILEVCATDMDDEDLEIPYLRFFI